MIPMQAWVLSALISDSLDERSTLQSMAYSASIRVHSASFLRGIYVCRHFKLFKFHLSSAAALDDTVSLSAFAKPFNDNASPPVTVTEMGGMGGPSEASKDSASLVPFPSLYLGPLFAPSSKLFLSRNSITHVLRIGASPFTQVDGVGYH